ncbi:MAG TPA: hypothetical protein VJU81_03625 [Methylomirabilota bacterium]|nr:hypothetical protein [Methylomirabilota bacterium]
MSSHAEECWAHQKLEEARAEAARQNLVASLRDERPLRVVVGEALIRTGRWLAGTPSAQPKRLAA